ncbi:hypothetical protein CPB83DRAFT_902501 [Crepidotus variabilis]|uniref:Uncharacterized protein n=1 Tax=Crepidotus variabilis TaxID=179855 RepID=A0A9P6JUT7_9AGAR|nr:hypothetical protein CPB83DRAFT_902501 [Crepidotus variabilis]
MALRRNGTPLINAPLPSLEASNQSQIDDLVQRNRTLEHTIQTLSAQTTTESLRSKSAIEAIQLEHDAQKLKWKEALEDVLGSYRIVQRRLELEVERERTGKIKEMEEVRRERKERSKREFKLRLWIMDGEEMRQRIEDTEAELEDTKEQWEEKEAELAAKYREMKEKASKIQKELKGKDAELSTLREKHANLSASHSTFESKLQRLQLNLDLSTTKNETLNQDLLEEKKRTSELTRQLEHWQSLDNKDGEEVEGLRKKNDALARTKEQLEKKIAELEEEREKGDVDGARIAVLEKELKKEKGRVEKMKIVTQSWKEEAKTHETAAAEASATIKQHTSELEELKKSNERLEKRITKLKDDLEVERARVAPSVGRYTPPAADPTSRISSEGLEVLDAPPPATGASKKPSVAETAAIDPATKRVEKDAKSAAPAPAKRTRQVARKSTGGKPPPLRAAARKEAAKAREEEEEIDGVEEIDDPREESDAEGEQPKKGKAKAKEKPKSTSNANSRKRKASEDDEEEGEGPKKKSKPASKKRKAASDDEVEVIDQPPTKPKSKSKPKPASTTTKPKPASRAASKAPSRAGSVKPGAGAKGKQKADATVEEEAEEEDDEATRKKKKRKINIFGPGPGDKGAVNILSQFNASTLDIPTVLSPIRQDDVVPARSGSTLGSLASYAKRSFMGR